MATKCAGAESANSSPAAPWRRVVGRGAASRPGPSIAGLQVGQRVISAAAHERPVRHHHQAGHVVEDLVEILLTENGAVGFIHRVGARCPRGGVGKIGFEHQLQALRRIEAAHHRGFIEARPFQRHRSFLRGMPPAHATVGSIRSVRTHLAHRAEDLLPVQEIGPGASPPADRRRFAADTPWP